MRRRTEAAGKLGARHAGVELFGPLLIELLHFGRRDVFEPLAVEDRRPLEGRPRFVVVAVNAAQVGIAPRSARGFRRLGRKQRASDKRKQTGCDKPLRHGSLSTVVSGFSRTYFRSERS